MTSWGWQRGNLRKTLPWVPEVGELAKDQKKTGFNQSQSTKVCQKGHLSEILLWRGEVTRHVTMVAKLLNLNNLSWQRRPFAMSNDGRKSWATVLFLLSAIMKRKVVHVNYFILFYHICRTTVCWDPENLLPWQRDVTTLPQYWNHLTVSTSNNNSDRTWILFSSRAKSECLVWSRDFPFFLERFAVQMLLNCQKGILLNHLRLRAKTYHQYTVNCIFVKLFCHAEILP